MKSFHQTLRASGLLRPAQEHAQQTGWRDTPQDFDWHSGNPAIVSANTEKLRKARVAKKKVTKFCGAENCDKPVYKGSPLCHDHFLERHRQRDKIWRDKQPKREKRYCGKCGKEIRGKQTALLCAEHYNQMQCEQRAKNTAELDALKEAHQTKSTTRLERRWQKIRVEYANGQR